MSFRGREGSPERRLTAGAQIRLVEQNLVCLNRVVLVSETRVYASFLEGYSNDNEVERGKGRKSPNSEVKCILISKFQAKQNEPSPSSGGYCPPNCFVPAGELKVLDHFILFPIIMSSTYEYWFYVFIQFQFWKRRCRTFVRWPVVPGYGGSCVGRIAYGSLWYETDGLLLNCPMGLLLPLQSKNPCPWYSPSVYTFFSL